MADHTIINQKTFGKRLKTYIITGIGAAMMLGGIAGVRACGKSRSQTKRAHMIDAAIAAKDYGHAKELLTPDALRPQDYSALGRSIMRGLESRTIERLVDNYDIEGAKKELDRLRGLDLFARQHIDDLETMIETHTDSGLYQRLIASGKQEKSSLCNMYLEHYPAGEHARPVRAELIHNDLQLLIDSLKSQRSFEDTYTRLVNLNALLRKDSMKGCAIPADTIGLLEDIQPDRYIAHIYAPWKEKLMIKDRVMVNSEEATGEHLSGYTQYISERNAVFPQYATGTVIYTYDDRSRVYVQFEELDEAFWSDDHSLNKYWKKTGKKNVAFYNEDELLIGRPVDELSRQKFMESWSEFRSIIEGYRQDEQIHDNR